jgi:hypothetical protein
MGNQEWTIETPTTLGTRHRIRQTKQQQQTLTRSVTHIVMCGKCLLGDKGKKKVYA